MLEAKITTIKESVEMTKEETAFYDFAIGRLKRLNISQKQQLKAINHALDGLNKSKPAIITKLGQQYFLGSAILRKSISKIEKTKEYVKKHKSQAVIYTTNDWLAKSIAEEIDGVVFVEANDNRNIEYAINEAIKDNVVVINVLRCLTGIDIHAKSILWYQAPLSASEDLQGSGRITRLSSKIDVEREIVYLYFDNTLQEDWITELADAYVINASLSNKKDKEKTFAMGLSF